MSYCPDCGTPSTGGRFCGSCGATITSSAGEDRSAGFDDTAGTVTGGVPTLGFPRGPGTTDGGHGVEGGPPPPAEPPLWAQPSGPSSPGPQAYPDGDPGYGHPEHETAGPSGWAPYPAYEAHPAPAGWNDPGGASPRRRTPLLLGIAGLALLGGLVFAIVRLGDDTPAPTAATSPSTTAASAPGPAVAATPPGGSSAASPSPSMTTTPPAATDAAMRTAAATVDALLTRSAEQRGLLRRAMDRCGRDPAGAATDLEIVLEGRRQLLAESQGTPFDALPSGAQLADHLRTAWEHSAKADEAFLEAARSGNCSESNPSFQRGLQESRSAQASKTAFYPLWESQVRKPLGLPTERTNDNI